MSVDSVGATISLPLDLSHAFDTFDLKSILNGLQITIEFKIQLLGALHDRTKYMYITIGQETSVDKQLSNGLPPGFSVGAIAFYQWVLYHAYADDTHFTLMFIFTNLFV